MPQVDRRVIAVTEGARGIGTETATDLARRGALVAIGDIDEVADKDPGALPTAMGATRGYLDSDPDTRLSYSQRIGTTR